MPVSVVVGGQYGSEGKGKVALELVRRDPSIRIVVRPGGTNSGHTGYARNGRRLVLRQLPAAAIDQNVRVVLPAGSYIDPDILMREIAEVGLADSQLIIDPRAQIITRDHVQWEVKSHLTERIGSTGSGTGAAVLSRIGRGAPQLPPALSVTQVPQLKNYIRDSVPILRTSLDSGERVLIEGTQGFGLSPLNGDSWPNCTSRDTTASAFVTEAGLSPLDVDEVAMVIRCHPIRVAGNSGPLPNETSWERIAEASGAPQPIGELTSVTARIRRVGLFDEEVVRRAIAINAPTKLALNHVDYVDWGARDRLTERAATFIRNIEQRIGRSIDFIGTGPERLQDFLPAQAEAA